MRWLALAAGCCWLFSASPVEAAKCSISSTPVAFGGYNVFAPGPVESTGSVVYNCNGGASNVWITISPGQGTITNRAMRKGLESLFYNLYVDAARTTIWGNGSSGTSVHFSRNPPNNEDVTVTMYGRIPPSQDVTAGAYTDQLVVEINF